MSLYKIELKNSIENDLKKIDKQYLPKIFDAIESLSNNPFHIQSKKLQDAKSSYRLRIGDYRIIYQINHEVKTITIIYIRHRKDSYTK